MIAEPCPKLSIKLKSYRHMDGDREISIRIFLVWCRAIVEEVLKTFQTARKGSQDMTAGNNFLRQNGDPTITEEAKGFEELDFRQNKRSASYITGWIFMFYIKHWGPSVSKYSREGVEFETQPVLWPNTTVQRSRLKNCHFLWLSIEELNCTQSF